MLQRHLLGHCLYRPLRRLRHLGNFHCSAPDSLPISQVHAAKPLLSKVTGLPSSATPRMEYGGPLQSKSACPHQQLNTHNESAPAFMTKLIMLVVSDTQLSLRPLQLLSRIKVQACYDVCSMHDVATSCVPWKPSSQPLQGLSRSQRLRKPPETPFWKPANLCVMSGSILQVCKHCFLRSNKQA